MQDLINKLRKLAEAEQYKNTAPTSWAMAFDTFAAALEAEIKERAVEGAGLDKEETQQASPFITLRSEDLEDGTPLDEFLGGLIRKAEKYAGPYISLEAAIADLELYEKQVVKNEYALAIAGCRSRISNLPAADVREVKRGRWITKTFHSVVCPECNFELDLFTPRAGEYFFCPICGLEMQKYET